MIFTNKSSLSFLHVSGKLISIPSVYCHSLSNDMTYGHVLSLHDHIEKYAYETTYRKYIHKIID